MNLRRMEGEVIRDSLLFLAGRLDPTMGGPDLPVDVAEAGTRRSIYYRYARDDTIPLLIDVRRRERRGCYRRHETIVPQQALALINSGMVLTRAAEIAAAIDREVGERAHSSERRSWSSAFERILGRQPTAAERAECEAGLGSAGRGVRAESQGDAEPDPEARARSALVHVLLEPQRLRHDPMSRATAMNQTP